MILTIDVGNSSITSGIFKGSKLIFKKSFLRNKKASQRYYILHFTKMLKKKKVETVIISSVVPSVTIVLKKIFKDTFGLKPVVLGENFTVPIKNLYKDPKQVGQDRLVNAYAGYKKFGGGLIIVDFGTAVTFDIVSKKGEYLGGIIVPGIEISMNVLSQKAALLPKIKLQRTSSLIGRDTVASMRSGILNGYGALCNGLIARLKKELGGDYKVILTGGHSKIISKFCNFHNLQPNLTLEGLYLVYKKIS